MKIADLKVYRNFKIFPRAKAAPVIIEREKQFWGPERVAWCLVKRELSVKKLEIRLNKMIQRFLKRLSSFLQRRID